LPAAPPAPPAPPAAPTPLPRPAPELLETAPTGDNTEVAYRELKPPRYPAEALRQREQGEVVTKVHVGTDGEVLEAGLLSSSGSQLLDEAALAAVAEAHFHPARRSGRAVASWVAVPYRFSLEEDTERAPEPAVPDIAASYKRLSPPHYPASAKAAGQEGTALLQVALDSAGAVQTVEVEASSGAAALDRAAADAVRRWLFNPAQRNGEAVASEVRVPVQFFAAGSSAEAYAAPAGALDTISLRGD
jgi:TonB family protein